MCVCVLLGWSQRRGQWNRRRHLPSKGNGPLHLLCRHIHEIPAPPISMCYHVDAHMFINASRRTCTHTQVHTHKYVHTRFCPRAFHTNKISQCTHTHKHTHDYILTNMCTLYSSFLTNKNALCTQPHTDHTGYGRR